MGFSTKGASGGVGRNSVPTTLAEINVTPLVDVMLVLLIIFMVAAPMMQQGVPIDLPKTTSGALNEVPDQLVLVVDKNRRILIGNKPIERGTLRARLQAIASTKPDMQVFIQGDQSLPYGYIAQVMAEVKRARIHRVGLVTVPADNDRSL